MDKMDNLKTERGKINQIQKFYNSLTPYFDLMNEENIEYITELNIKHIHEHSINECFLFYDI